MDPGPDEGAAGDDHKERGPVRFPPPAIYVAGILVAIALEVWISTPALHPALTIGGTVLFLAVAIYLDGGASARFVKRGTPMAPWLAPKALVTDGPYRLTRNPMYLGMAFLYSGIALAFGLLWAFALLPVVLIVVDRAVIRREEPYLEDRFGEDYKRYRSEVRRWI